MEEDHHHQELRFVCKLCNKKYPCGKSLGGHMRSHGISNSAESQPNHNHKTKHLPHNNLPSLSPDPSGISGQFNSSYYGLREKPRKTWRRAVDSSSTSPFPVPQDRVCKQCGKGFHSLKALCGHMASHSNRDHKPLKDIDHSWTVTTRKLQQQQQMVFDSHSDTEEEPMVHTRSLSKLAKNHKKIPVRSSCMTSPHPPTTTNGSSSVSEIDGDEQEEVAMCLMLLSRDSGSKGGIICGVESSDNNSVILETKSSSIDKKTIHDHGDAAPPANNEVEEENSDSGYFLDECGKAESDVLDDGLCRYNPFNDHHYKSIKREVHCSGEFRNMGRRNSRAVAKRELTEETDSYDKYIRFSRLVRNHDSPKRSKYECFNCHKTFQSYQALGGHRPCYKRSNAYNESRSEGGDNSLDCSTEFIESARNRKSSAKKDKVVRKNKGHVCPFCNRVFKNGQALGGHKRSHFASHKIRNERIPAKPDLLDLNLPAPEEDDNNNGNSQISHW